MPSRQLTLSFGSLGACERFSLLVARIKGLRSAVRGANFRMAQRLQLALPLYVRHVETQLRKDIDRLFDLSRFWVRNVGDRRQTKRSTLQITVHLPAQNSHERVGNRRQATITGGLARAGDGRGLATDT